MMSRLITPSALLRQALLLDAVASGAAGLLMLLAGPTLAGLLALPEPLLRYAGLICLLWAAFVSWLWRKPQLSRAIVLAVIALNALWVVDSVLLLVSGWVQPNALGSAFVLVMAAAVGGLAAVQALGLRRAPQPALA
jgi:CHASE2 domain-containing sensor protein